MVSGNRAELKDELALVPDKPGVYLFRNQAGAVIYVGKAVSLRNRIRSYFQSKPYHPRIARMLQEVVRFEYIVTDSEVEALVLECNLIKEYQPKFNISLKDDKSYPYLKVTADEFPRVAITRKLERDGSRYFGPYPNVKAVRETLDFLRKLFPFRTCREKNPAPRSRPCLDAQIKKCLAPCTGRVSPETYREMIDQVVLFLEGKTEEVEKRLRAQMEKAVESLNFEQAARLRDRLAAIRQFREQQRVARAGGSDEDVLAFGSFLDEACVLVFRIRGGNLVAEEHYFLTGTEGFNPGEVLSSFIKQYYHSGREVPRAILVSAPLPEGELLAQWLSRETGRKVEVRFPRRGRGKELVQLALKNATMYAQQRHEKRMRNREKGRRLVAELQKALGLPRLPRVLECLDISHLAGQETVGSLVRFTEGSPDRSGYRRYRIQKEARGDDYAALQEVVRRRFSRAKELPLPDLLLVDGGKGQLNAVLAVLAELGVEGVSVASLAKEEEVVYLPGEKDPLRLPLNHPGLHLLQQARDEAHRFAVSYQRKLREKRLKASILCQVPGIGKKRQEALLQYFGSISRIKEATVEELAAVPGMNRKAALDLYKFFHGDELLKTARN
jgi:excinuclease ABC subunit C